MKAMICTRYGPPDVLQLKEVEKPAPKDDEVLIKVHAASINSRDWRLMRANPFFLRLMTRGVLKPKNTILGADMAGWVEAVGSNVKQFLPGDEVFGVLSRYGGRTFAEYVSMSLLVARCYNSSRRRGLGKEFPRPGARKHMSPCMN